MKQIKLRVTFTTPAFLGNAEQKGQWRTPPFKALLRQWWRVAYAAQANYRVNEQEMRHAEGLLFGHAWLEDDCDHKGDKVAARRSAIRLRLQSDNPAQNGWATGTQTGVAPLSTGIDTSYARFGLVNRGNGLPDKSAIKPAATEGQRNLLIAYPDQHHEILTRTLQLINEFGHIGSRSRGGWGSFHLSGVESLGTAEINRFGLPLVECLRSDWARALALKEDGKPAIWHSSRTFASWDKAMRDLAIKRKEVRTSLKRAPRDLSAALGFADKNGRMASPLRWKIVARDNNQLGYRIFAMPHLLPVESGKRMEGAKLASAWQQVFNYLDSQMQMGV
jgi:CRISPR-associated protein Cmr1